MWWVMPLPAPTGTPPNLLKGLLRLEYVQIISHRFNEVKYL